jgi:hypothetical protein
MRRRAKRSRGFTGVRPLAFIALGAALFLGALIYARGCAGIMLDVILGAGVALFLLVYMTYALLWPEEL